MQTFRKLGLIVKFYTFSDSTLYDSSKERQTHLTSSWNFIHVQLGESHIDLDVIVSKFDNRNKGSFDRSKIFDLFLRGKDKEKVGKEFTSGDMFRC